MRPRRPIPSSVIESILHQGQDGTETGSDEVSVAIEDILFHDNVGHIGVFLAVFLDADGVLVDVLEAGKCEAVVGFLMRLLVLVLVFCILLVFVFVNAGLAEVGTYMNQFDVGSESDRLR